MGVGGSNGGIFVYFEGERMAHDRHHGTDIFYEVFPGHI
jgi:hypothetical protein